MDQNLQFQDVPVSILFSVSIVIIFALYTTTAIKSIPCEKDLLSVFKTNFIHTDFYHISANLYTFYALSRVEQNIGSKQFLLLIIFLLIFNSIIEVLIYKLIPNMPCSIGFSGVLYGLMSYELVTTKDIDFVLLSSIVLMTILPSINKTNISLTGHAVGAFSGIIGGVIWKNIYKK